MKAVVSALVAIVSVSDIIGLIDLPLFASIGIFSVMLLIVLDTVFSSKDES